MELDLTDAQRAHKTAFDAFVERVVMPAAAENDRTEKLSDDLLAQVAAEGYLGACLPAAAGGLALDAISYGLLQEALGQGCCGVRSLLTVHTMVAQTILRWGNEEQRQRWLKPLSTGEAIAAFALTEPEVGSDAGSVQLAARPDGDDLILNGHKQWVTVGQIAHLFLVIARGTEGLLALLVERNTPGFDQTPISGLMGCRAAMLAELTFTDCRVPAKNVVGRPGFGFSPVALHALDWGRYSIAWGCVGLAQASLNEALEHARNRHQFGKPLKEHQLVQQMVAEALVNVKAARMLCYRAGQLREQGDPDAPLETMVAKYYAANTANQVANDAVQILGAVGVSDRSPVERYLRDAKIMDIIEGTRQILQLAIADYAFQLEQGSRA